MARTPAAESGAVGSEELESGSGTVKLSLRSFNRLLKDSIAAAPIEIGIRKFGGGEGGIRTLGTLLRYGALAKRCFRPLSHLTNRLREYEVEGYSST